MDELIAEYTAKLQAIYDNRTAGDHTFTGVLSEFARAVVMAEHASVDYPADRDDNVRLWSSHGHWIAGGHPSDTQMESRPLVVVRCGGSALCQQCSREQAQNFL